MAIAMLSAITLVATVSDNLAAPRDGSDGAGGPAERADRAPGEAVPAWAPSREWTVGAYLGSPYTYDSDVKITKPGTHDFTVKDVEWFGQPFTNPIYYGVRVSRWFEGGRTGAMLDFTHSKAISRRDQEAKFEGTYDGKPAPEKALIGDVFKKLEASHGHNMLTLNGLVRLPSLSWRFSPYVGLGAGINLPHSEVHVVTEPSRTYEYQMTGPVGQALVGLEVRLARTSYFLEYKFSLADYWMPLSGRDGYILPYDLWLQIQRWWNGDEPRDGWAATRLTSHQVIGGLSVRVAAP
ncbi:MAG: hypothetical protein NW216_11680 [Hyphomicrobium sp.]|nr:hypothetical protein [Hyphomicrobium sp.]